MRFKSILLIRLIALFLTIVNFSCADFIFKINTPKGYKSSRKDLINIITWYDDFIRKDTATINLLLPDNLSFNSNRAEFYKEKELINIFKINYPEKLNQLIFYLAEQRTTASYDLNLDSTHINFLYINHWNNNFNIDSFIRKKDSLSKNEGHVTDSLNELLFSNFYVNKSIDAIPKGFYNFVNGCLKEIVDLYKDETFYSSINGTKISFENKGNFPLWFLSDKSSKTIFISPDLIRAVYIIAYNIQYTELSIAKRSDPEQYTDLVKMKYGNYEQDFELYNIFRQRFISELSFLFQHELAHIYLGKGDAAERNELRCDCYAYYHRKLPIVLGPFFNIAGNDNLGIYARLLESSIINNRPDLWNLQNLLPLKKRFYYVDSGFKKFAISPIVCDSIAKSENLFLN